MMATCPIPENEPARLQALLELQVLDTAPERTFEDITRIAASICGAPMAAVTLIDERRQWFKSRFGFEATETPREIAFCAHAIMKRDITVVEDATRDERFRRNPLVTGEMGIRFYAGVPLMVAGTPVGTLAVLDTVPRTITAEQRATLVLLGQHCATQLEARHHAFTRQEMLEGVLDASPLAIILLDREGNVISWNRSAERIFGWKGEEVLNRPYPAVPEGAESEFARTLAGMMSGREYQFDTRRRRKDGSTFPARVWAASIRNQFDSPIGAVVLIEDLTQQQVLENNLLQLGAAVSASKDAIILQDMDGTIRSWAGAAEEMYGYSASEIVGQNIAVLVPSEHRHRITSAHERIRNGESFTRANIEHVRKDGRRITVSISFAPLRNSGQEITGVCAVMRDITSQALVEQQLAQAQKMEAVGRLAGGVAHDFNNMLGVILGYAELGALNLPPDSQQRKNLEMIKTTALRSADLTRQLLAFSRKQVLQPVVLRLDEVVAESQKMISRVIGEDIDLQLQLGAGEGRVYCDRSQLQQVLMNLAVNARDAMPEGGILRISTSNATGRPLPDLPRARYLVLSISDTGCGMRADTCERIFEPFYTTKEQGKGTGLGLSIVHGIVTQSGGHVEVRSELGVGTTFDIYLPEAKGEAVPQPASESDAEASCAAKGTVLLIEDEFSLRRVIEERLRTCGYTVWSVENGEEALRLMAERQLTVDAVVTDVVMPKVSGKQVVRELRSRYPRIKVLYMSGYAEGVLDPADIGDDGIDFIAKPFTAAALSKILSRLLNGER